MDKKNLSVIRQNFGNVVYTQKCHEIAAEFDMKYHTYIKVINIIIVSLILIFLIIQVNQMDNPLYSYICAGLTIGDIIFLITQLNFNFVDQATQHKKVALSLIPIREKYISLMADILNTSITIKDTIKCRDQLLSECSTIYHFSPITSRYVFKEAQRRLNPRGIVDGEDFTFTDEEINRFLPQELQI